MEIISSSESGIQESSSSVVWEQTSSADVSSPSSDSGGESSSSVNAVDAADSLLLADAQTMPPAGFYSAFAFAAPEPAKGGVFRCTFDGTQPTSATAETKTPVIEFFFRLPDGTHVDYFAKGSSSPKKDFDIDAGIGISGGWSRNSCGSVVDGKDIPSA